MTLKTTILLTAFTCTCTVLTAQQQAKIILQDGTEKQVEIKAFSSNTIFTEAGNIQFKDIKEAAFSGADKAARVIPKLLAAGVLITIDGQPWEKTALKAPAIVQLDSQGNTLAASHGLDFEKFRKQRDVAKGLQLVGAAAITYSLVASWINQERAREDGEDAELIDLSPAIPAIGGAFLTIGILIDVEAGKHLRLRPY